MNSAFPNFSMADGEGHCQHNPGLSKREYFAAMAMQALINAGETAYHNKKTGDPTVYAVDYAASAVKFADALIAGLAKPAEE